MKVALCSCGKLENAYIREWVTYYYRIGVSKIFLYDNNETYGEYFEDVINDYITSGFVELIDWRGKKKPQCKIETDCWEKHKNEYNWICFFDCDEYLSFIKDDSINDYLSRDCFNEFQIIHINFLAYGDCDNLYNTGEPLYKRFNKALPVDSCGPLPFPNNAHCKSIVRGNTPDINWVRDGHTPLSDTAKFCDNSGHEIPRNQSCCIINYELAALRHYSTKTITEYITTKFKRGDVILSSDGLSISDLIGGILTFFSFNKIDNPKIDIVKALIKDQYETSHNAICVDAGGRIGNMLFTLIGGLWYAEYYHKKLYVLLESEDKFKFREYWLNILNNFPNIKNSIEIVDSLECLGPNYVTCYEKVSIEYNEIPNKLNSNLYIKGYRQSPKYWNNSIEFAMDLLKMPDRIKNKISTLYPDIVFYDYVSINVRRGDYLGFCEKIYTLPSVNWYKKAGYTLGDKFIITSDDIEWCKTQFKGDNFIFIDIEDEDKILIDLYIQSLCKHNVVSCSTFSWWGAYLNVNPGRKVIYKKPWMKITDAMDIIPENDNWIEYNG